MNWTIWTVAVLVVLGVLGSVTAKPTATTAGHPTGSPSLSASQPSGTPPASSAGTASRPSPPGRATTGAVVVTASGVVLPNRTRTPGATNPDVAQANIGVTICVAGWTTTIRPPSAFTTTLKEQQLATGYTYRGDRNPGDYEEDHLIPLELGGAPRSQLNLWPEPYHATAGAQMKDQIEDKLHALVCHGALRLAAAQHAIAANWFTAYQTYLGTATPTPSPTQATKAPAPPPSTPPPPPPASPLTCSASMSNPNPADYTTTDVIVHTGVPGAAVTATAHYKTTDTTHTGTADGNGVADIAFRDQPRHPRLHRHRRCDRHR